MVASSTTGEAGGGDLRARGLDRCDICDETELARRPRPKIGTVMLAPVVSSGGDGKSASPSSKLGGSAPAPYPYAPSDSRLEMNAICAPVGPLLGKMKDEETANKAQHKYLPQNIARDSPNVCCSGADMLCEEMEAEELLASREVDDDP